MKYNQNLNMFREALTRYGYKEPGCAVRAAMEAGEIDKRRLRNYNAIKKEEARSRRKRKTLTGKDPDLKAPVYR